jgi:hypothetical protein
MVVYLQITLKLTGLQLLFLNFLFTLRYSFLIGCIFFLQSYFSLLGLQKV